MSLTTEDRLNAVLLAKSIYHRREVLDFSGEIDGYLDRLSRYGMFSVGELADLSGLSEYRIKKMSPPLVLFNARRGVFPSHLDYLVRMVDNPDFCKMHIGTLLESGATPSGVSRITGYNERTLRRWAGKE